MIAYAETYVAGAQRRLGAAFETAVCAFGLSLEAFYQQFLSSTLSVRFASGEPAVVAGKSGEEIAYETLGCDTPPEWVPPAGATPEYWAGWALAFYQWASGSGFAEIERCVSIGDICRMYAPYHEMDVWKFCDKMDELMRAARPKTNLQMRRLAAGLSQRQLAEAAGVPVRTLQQYEQRQKDVNRARADYVMALARALCCHPDELLEHQACSSITYATVEMK